MIGRKKASKARARLARLSDMEILNWSDQAGSGVAKALNDYRSLKMPQSLDEAKEGLEVLLAAVEELLSRTDG